MPYSNMALDADRQNGPAARSFAADAHAASWSGSNDPTVYKSVARRCAPMASSPRILTRRPPRSYAKARLAVHSRSACSGVKALRNTSSARRQAAKLCYRFGPLTPSARSANLIVGDGTKNGFPSSEQKTGKNQKRPLDRKSPIQVRIHLPPAASRVRTRFLDHGWRRRARFQRGCTGFQLDRAGAVCVARFVCSDSSAAANPRSPVGGRRSGSSAPAASSVRRQPTAPTHRRPPRPLRHRSWRFFHQGTFAVGQRAKRLLARDRLQNIVVVPRR